MAHPKLVRRAGSDKWYTWVPRRGGGTRLVSTGCTDTQAARIRAAELQRVAVDPGYAAAQKTSVRELLTQFIASRKRRGRKPGTLHHYGVKCGHLARLLPEFVADVTHAVMEKYIDTRITEGVEPTTVKKELRALGAAWRLGARNRLVAATIDEVMPEYEETYEPVERVLTLDELRRVCRELPASRAAWVAFSVATGAELAAIKRALRSDIAADFSLVQLHGTKRKTRERAAPIPLEAQRQLLREVLRHADGAGDRLFLAWVSVRRDLKAAAERASVCNDCRSKRAQHRGEGGKFGWRRTPGCAGCEATPVVKPLSPNDLRRTYGTWLRNAGAEPALIAPAMGHIDSRMVERVYGRIQPEALRRNLLAAVGNVSSDTRETEGKAVVNDRSGVALLPAITVPRDGIEPPTRGFSIPLTLSENPAKTPNSDNTCRPNVGSDTSENAEEGGGPPSDKPPPTWSKRGFLSPFLSATRRAA